jgi:DNA-binding transcriptional ArsR family regulator
MDPLTACWVSSSLPFVPTNQGAVLEALADPSRRSIFELLAERPMSVVEITASVPISRPAVSQHLRVLKDARLVAVRPSGTRRIYSLDPEGLDAVRRYFERFWAGALAAYAREADVSSRSHHPSEEKSS